MWATTASRATVYKMKNGFFDFCFFAFFIFLVVAPLLHCALDRVLRGSHE